MRKRGDPGAMQRGKQQPYSNSHGLLRIISWFTLTGLLVKDRIDTKDNDQIGCNLEKGFCQSVPSGASRPSQRSGMRPW